MTPICVLVNSTFNWSNKSTFCASKSLNWDFIQILMVLNSASRLVMRASIVVIAAMLRVHGWAR